jgi:hypothetical protein
MVAFFAPVSTGLSAALFGPGTNNPLRARSSNNFHALLPWVRTIERAEVQACNLDASDAREEINGGEGEHCAQPMVFSPTASLL